MFERMTLITVNNIETFSKLGYFSPWEQSVKNHVYFWRTNQFVFGMVYQGWVATVDTCPRGLWFSSSIGYLSCYGGEKVLDKAWRHEDARWPLVFSYLRIIFSWKKWCLMLFVICCPSILILFFPHCHTLFTDNHKVPYYAWWLSTI